MTHASTGSRSSRNATATPSLPATPKTHTSVQATLAMLEAKNVLGPQFKELAEQISLPSARYADLFAKMSTTSRLAEVTAPHRAATASLAVQTLASNPAWLEATRSLSKSVETQHMSALSKLLGDMQASGVFTRVSAHWAAEQSKLLAAVNLQLPALSSSLLAGIARPANEALLGKVADLVKGMDVSVANSLAVQNAASMAARSMTLGLSRQLRSSGLVPSSAWQKLCQDLQLADGLGSLARLAAIPGPLLRSQTLASGVGSYASVQRVLSDLGGCSRC